MFKLDSGIFKPVLLTILICSFSASAQQAAVLLDDLEATSPEKSPLFVSKPMPPETLGHLFFGGLSKYHEGNAGEASASFKALRDTSSEGGYLNLSEFSIILLRNARAEAAQGNTNDAKFLIHWADELSPADSRVSLLSAGFPEITGYGDSISKLWKSLVHLPGNPTLFATFLINTLLVGLAGLTIALFVTALLQLSRNAESVVLNISQLVPLNYRGIFGPIIALIVLASPLCFGLLPAVCVWSILLGLFLKNCKWFPALTGAAVLCWGAGMLIAERVGPHLSQEINFAAENVNNRTYAPQDKKFLASAIEENPSDLVTLFLYGQVVGREGNHEESSKIFSSIVNLTRKKEDIHKKAKLNLAAVYLRSGKQQEAGRLLEELLKSGERTFEAYYNMAQVKMAALDTAGHRNMFKLASDVDSQKMDWLEKYKSSSVVPLFASLPADGFFERYSRPVTNISVSSEDKIGDSSKEFSKELVYSSLTRNGSVFAIVILGAFTLFVGLFIRFRKSEESAVGQYNSSFFGQKKSVIWHGFPCGGLVTGRRPIAGAILLGILTSLVIVAVQNPVELLPVSRDLYLEKGNFFIALAVVLFLLITSFTLIFNRDGDEEGETKNA